VSLRDVRLGPPVEILVDVLLPEQRRGGVEGRTHDLVLLNRGSVRERREDPLRRARDTQLVVIFSDPEFGVSPRLGRSALAEGVALVAKATLPLMA